MKDSAKYFSSEAVANSNETLLPRPRIFISHQWADEHVADRLQRNPDQLAEVWLDIRNFSPGRRIKSQIDSALAEMDAVLLLWSSNSARSKNVLDEIAAAERHRLTIYPITLEHDGDVAPLPELPTLACLH